MESEQYLQMILSVFIIVILILIFIFYTQNREVIYIKPLPLIPAHPHHRFPYPNVFHPPNGFNPPTIFF